MSATLAPAAATEQPSFLERHAFLLRRLHSLSGVVPVGLFVTAHLSFNATVLLGDSAYQWTVNQIHMLGPLLLTVEIFFIFLPIIFHAALGIAYTLSARENVGLYPYGANWRYLVQRITGILLVLFILFHVGTLWAGLNIGKYTPFVPRDDSIPNMATESASYALQYADWVLVVYLVGVASAVFHWANGLWTFLITWGITISPGAQRRSGYACAAFGALLFAASLGSLWKFTTREIDPRVNAQTVPVLREAYENKDGPGHGVLPDTTKGVSAETGGPLQEQLDQQKTE